MAKFPVYCLILILAGAQVFSAMAESPFVAARKLGKLHMMTGESGLTPTEAPGGVDELPAEVSATGEVPGPAGEEEVMKVNHHRHRSIDKSVAGGGVIIGGLATTFLVAIFCYIRATRRRSAEPGSPTNSDSSAGRRNLETESPLKL